MKGVEEQMIQLSFLSSYPNKMNAESQPTSTNRADGQRRYSSFSSSTSPWFRRNSFLSPTMIQNENFSVYDSPSYLPESSSYSIISLSECQGFIFNQDLFASPYQQVRSQANERKIRALSFSRGGKSKCIMSNSRNSSFSSVSPPLSSKAECSSSSSLQSSKSAQRRHTSYHAPRPFFNSTRHRNVEDAVVDDDHDHEVIDDEDNEDEEMHDAQDVVLDSDVSDEQHSDDEDEYDIESEEEEDQEGEEDDDDDDEDEDDEFESMHYSGSGNTRYKVHVTEIVIDESDCDIFPS